MEPGTRPPGPGGAAPGWSHVQGRVHIQTGSAAVEGARLYLHPGRPPAALQWGPAQTTLLPVTSAVTQGLQNPEGPPLRSPRV